MLYWRIFATDSVVARAVRRYNQAMKSLVAALTFSLTLPAFAHQVIAITDGDTLTLLVNQKPLKLHLANVDAPERTQPFGRFSRQSLHELCFGKDADFKEQDIDRYGEPKAVVSCGGVDVGREQIVRGMAWVVDKDNRDFTLPALQMMARRDRKGLWTEENPVPPWEHRRPQVKRASMVPSREKADPAFCYIDRRGEYRIIDGVRRYGC